MCIETGSPEFNTIHDIVERLICKIPPRPACVLALDAIKYRNCPRSFVISTKVEKSSTLLL